MYHHLRPGARIRIADRPCDILSIAKLLGGQALLVVRFEDTQEIFCLSKAEYPWTRGRKLASPNINVHWNKCPAPGNTWQHCGTGAKLGIIANAIDAVTGGHFVIYRDRATQEVLAMAAAEWFAVDADGRPCHSL